MLAYYMLYPYYFSAVLMSLYTKEGRMPSVHETSVLRNWVKELTIETGVSIKATQSGYDSPLETCFQNAISVQKAKKWWSAVAKLFG